VSVTKGRDDLWVEVKCQANLEIAGSPRNAFRCSPWERPTEVASRIGTGAYRLPTRTKRRMPWRAAQGVRQWEPSSIVKRETAQTAG
jgi:hypothetical protein